MFLKSNNVRKSFLSKLLTPTTGNRSFSRANVQAFVSADAATHASELDKDINPAFYSKEWQPLQSYSKIYLQKKKEEEVAEAEWLSQLRSPK